MEKKKPSSSSTTCQSRRLKREECHRTKHDSVFSKWKILIGALDWDNHRFGKDGSERYRLHNLPLSSSCPGIYELGIGTSHENARSSHLVRSQKVIIVYLGQAENVRTRLQHYGRAGSHLDNGNNYQSTSNCEFSSSSSSLSSSLVKNKKDPGFFKDVFNRGFSLVFRWAPMASKKQAEDVEFLMLGVFDYAWNKISNSFCRRDDILKKLDAISSRNPFTVLMTELKLLKQHVFDRKKHGIRIDARRKMVSSSYFDPQIIKFQKTRPRLIVERDEADYSDSASSVAMCGMVKEDGFSICVKKPVQGRKRCQQHKGMKGKVNRSGKSRNNTTVVCGVNLEDGKTCMAMPTKGRKRCDFHKGKRISKS